MAAPASSRHVRSTGPRRSRAGFTLVEIVVVLLILGIAAGAVAPALLRDDGPQDPVARTAEELAAVLRSARHHAVSGGVTTVLVLDPGSGRYWLEGDSVREGFLARAPGVVLVASTPRVRFEFSSTGGAWGQSVVVSGVGRGAVVTVDPWTGDADVQAQ
ncbi:MAG TPA: type II secretion system protein [Longimicrobiaceae bacterium]|nr:type II secretion system protein [Longimicrobiaceae bacterium]